MSNDKKTLSIHDTVMAEQFRKENNEFGMPIKEAVEKAKENYTGGFVLSDDGTLSVIVSLNEKMKELSALSSEIQLKTEKLIEVFGENEIAEKDYNEAKKLISEDIANYHELAAEVYNNPVYQMFDSVFKQWADFRDAFNENCDQIILHETKLKKSPEIINEKIATLSALIAEVDQDMEMEEKEAYFSGMFEMTGKDFKDLLANHEVISITGVICNVTDRSLTVQPTQPITLNDFGKIRPPYSVIQDDTPIYIDEIEFYHKDFGEILSRENLEQIF